MARECADAGYYLSFAGNITFKNAQNLRDSLKVTPLERILVETDAPFLTPVPYRGRPNASYLVPITVRFMATELDIDENELAAQIAENTLRRAALSARLPSYLATKSTTPIGAPNTINRGTQAQSQPAEIAGPRAASARLASR